ncbi:MAG: hypothetical protein JW806_04790 [Sedimentisphaerales bacterium]|nr:hypothetical protein [Sedimentisphaerales bacterium]
MRDRYSKMKIQIKDKSEARNPKSETISNIRNQNVQNNAFRSFSGFCHLDLFRNSIFGIRISNRKGSILIVVLFAISLLAAFVTGMLQMNMEQAQLMKNEAFMADALAIAEAGLADAFARVRTYEALPTDFGPVSFANGSYSVTITGSLPNPSFTSVGTSGQGYIARVEADVTVDTVSYVVRIDEYRINE